MGIIFLEQNNICQTSYSTYLLVYKNKNKLKIKFFLEFLINNA